MGDMTVAPLAVAPVSAAPLANSRITRCALCGTGSDAQSSFCSHCGAQLIPDAKAPAAVAATRSLQYAILVLVANIVVGGLALGVIFVTSDTSHLATAALQLEVLQFLVVGALVALTLRTGIRALRMTRGGRVGRRSWAVVSVAISSLVGLALVVSLVSTLVMVLGR